VRYANQIQFTTATPTAWLGRQDSNLKMSSEKMPFEMSDEFSLILERLRTRDFSRTGCQNTDMQLPAGMAA
jgi:hypothetical protein